MNDALLQAAAFVEAWGPGKDVPQQREAFIADLAEVLSKVGEHYIKEVLSK